MLFSQESDDWQRETPIGLSCLLDNRIYMSGQLLRETPMPPAWPTRSSCACRWSIPCSPISRGVVRMNTSCGLMAARVHYYGSGSKRVLIHALRDLLPLSISNRPKKGLRSRLSIGCGGRYVKSGRMLAAMPPSDGAACLIRFRSRVYASTPRSACRAFCIQDYGL